MYGLELCLFNQPVKGKIFFLESDPTEPNSDAQLRYSQ